MAVKLPKDDFTRGIVDKSILTPFINRYIEQTGDFSWEFTYKPKKNDGGFHPSSHCLMTPLEIYNDIVDPQPREFGADLRKTFMVGHFWHQYLQKIVVDMGFAKKRDIEAHKTVKSAYGYWFDPYISGSADAIVDIPGQGKYLVDFKTQKSLDFNQQDLPEWCKDKYICQINLYMDIFKVHQGLFVCINKDTSKFKEILVSYNKPLVEAIYRKFHIVCKAIRDNKPPPETLDIALPI